MQLLDQLIAQQPETLKPVLNQISSMFKSSTLAFDSHVSLVSQHVADNDTTFGQVQDQIRALSDRASDLEGWKAQTQADGASLRDRLAATEQSLSNMTAVISQKFDTVVSIVNALGASTQQTIAQVGDIKSSLDHLEIVVGGSMNPDGRVGTRTGALRNEYSYREINKFGNSDGDDFRHWRESVRDLCEVRPEGLIALEWAAAHKGEITADSVETAGYIEFSRELWSILGAKTKESPWRLRLAIADRNGLEHWRQLAAEYNPQSPEDAAVLQHQLLSLPACAPEALADTLTRVDGSIVEHDKMAKSPMSEDLRRAVYEKICPAGWLTSMRLAGVDISTAQRLKSQMLLHVRGGKHDAKMKGLTGHGVTAMDIGALSGSTVSPAVVESSKLLAEISNMQASLAALMAGKGGGQQSFGKGPWSQAGQPRADKSAKGKGKGADMRPGTRVCHAFSETGRCPHLEKYGYCKFKHVKGVPKSLAAVEGLRFEDLGQCTYSPKEDIYTCVPGDLDDKTLASQIAAEVEEINKEIAELEEFKYSDASTFTRH